MKLNFLPAGPDLGRPMEIGEALCLAMYGRPSADAHLWENADGDIKITIPWASVEEAKQKVQLLAVTYRQGAAMLGEGVLKSYVHNPRTGMFLLIPRHYWMGRDIHSELQAIDPAQATGWDSLLPGQPILVAQEDLPAWKAVADGAQQVVSSLASAGNPNARRPTTWRMKRIEPWQVQLGDFFERAEHGAALNIGHSSLYAKYAEWCRKRNFRRLGETAFKKWLNRFRAGHFRDGQWHRD